MKVCLYSHDPLLYLCYLPEEAKDIYGEVYYDEYGVEIPDELALEINEVYERLLILSEKIRKIEKDNV